MGDRSAGRLLSVGGTAPAEDKPASRPAGTAADCCRQFQMGGKIAHGRRFKNLAGNRSSADRQLICIVVSSNPLYSCLNRKVRECKINCVPSQFHSCSAARAGIVRSLTPIILFYPTRLAARSHV
jgi:hypothetical protein